MGVFICHCGTNIGGFLDVEDIEEYTKGLPDVVFTQRNLYTCSEEGLSQIKNGIKEHNLNRVIVASCTPRTHEPLFKRVCSEAGLNPYLFNFVNIREHCSWVHMHERKQATKKAKDLIRMGVARVRLLEPEEDIEIDVEPACLVIGGGIAGLTASTSLAKRGFKVVLVERDATLGGLLRDLYKLYPICEDATNVLEGRKREGESYPNLEILTSSEVKEIKGFVGNYEVTVDIQYPRHGIRIIKVGVIIVATGAKVLIPEGLYGYDGKRIITQLELEKRLKEEREKLKRLNNIVMIQCVGARGDKRAYCSKVCCMVAIKNATLISRLNPEAKIYIIYRDIIQVHGTEYEDYYREARDAGILFVRYHPENEPVVSDEYVKIYDEMLGEDILIPYDLLVLSTPLVSWEDASNLAKMLKVPLDENRFFLEAHVKLRPLDFATDGIYVCGTCHWPVSVPEAVSQALGAAARASIPMANKKVRVESIISEVDKDKCIACGLCASVCPYKAIEIKKTEGGKKAEVISASCKGCGSCGASCPMSAITMHQFTDEQILSQVKAVLP
ncbi:MAG: CoB--CoM heterodisulfide reductase iron-sulfur subunit A family protein [bacterium]|nr:CoB--CoM heterodisulfide reductase iron-sulfur subunit A family protein [bacterium]